MINKMCYIYTLIVLNSILRVNLHVLHNNSTISLKVSYRNIIIITTPIKYDHNLKENENIILHDSIKRRKKKVVHCTYKNVDILN